MVVALGCDLGRRRELLAVFECFFDDSGKESEPTNRFVVMAGYVAFTHVWSDFQQRWMHLLFKHELKHIHMKEIRGIATDKGWDTPKLNSVLGDFIGAIKASEILGFGVAVDADEWRKLSPERRRMFGDAQEFACSRILRRVRDRLVSSGFGNEQMAVVFDQDFGFARRRLTLIEEIRKRSPDLRKSLAQLCLADAERYYPLQAADILAWETRRELMNRVGEKPSASRWKDLMNVIPYLAPHYAAGEFWDKDNIERELPKVEAAVAKSGASAWPESGV